MTTSTRRHQRIELQPTWCGISVLGAGQWRIHTSSFAGVTDRGSRHFRAPIIDGAMTVGSASPGSLLLTLRTASPQVSTISAITTSVTDDGHGFARHRMDARIEDVDGASQCAKLTLTFHGVYRRSDESWAWLSGTGTTPTQRWRRRSMRIVLDLIASPTALHEPHGPVTS